MVVFMYLVSFYDGLFDLLRSRADQRWQRWICWNGIRHVIDRPAPPSYTLNSVQIQTEVARLVHSGK